MAELMKHVDLCSGIGGFALGFEWAGLSKPLMFCDIEPWSRKILAKHWPDVPIAEDVKELASDPARLVPDCDILTAGYPCPPFSVAGKRRGEEDDRHIWPEIFAIVQAKLPSWCVFENVPGHISLGLDQVLSDLESCCYATQAFCLPACGVDAPHRRDRIFVVAHADSSGLQGGAQTRNDEKNRTQPDDKQFARRSGAHKSSEGRSTLWKPEPNISRVSHGLPRRVDRIKGLGNAIVPQIAMNIGLTIKAVRNG